MVFALAGLFISVFYVAPPISLKKRGLGEPGVFLTWGPLMIGGTYFVATGTIPAWVWVASLPYAILVTTVLFGKHIDKIVPDAERGIRTLPVILGERRARLVASAPDDRVLSHRHRLGVGGLDRSMGPAGRARHPAPVPGPPPVLGAEAGDAARTRTSAWPLWFVGGAFIHTRRAGATLIIGLLLNVFLPVTLPWLS